MPPKLILDIDLLSRNKELSEKLYLISVYYTINNDFYKAKSFRTASEKINSHKIAILSGDQAQKEIVGIGKSINKIIDEYFETGRIGRLEELERKYLEQKKIIDYFTSFYGIGPKTAIKYYNSGLRTLKDLWDKGNLNESQKLGILWRHHINLIIEREEMDIIRDVIASILDPYDIKWDITGSYRREEKTSGDIDILVEYRQDINMDSLLKLLDPIISAKLAKGDTKFMGMLRISNDYNGHRIDIRIVDSISYPFALLYFTGSRNFNILMRKRAISMGLTLNEYELKDNKGNIIKLNSEEDIFNTLKIKYISPKYRFKNINKLESI